MMNSPGTPAPALAVEDVHKSFGGVRALGGVSFSIEKGEVLGLIGDNGAGKSTLVGCVSGVHSPDSGVVRFDGRPVVLESPHHARQLGIEVVHQDLALADNLDIASNLFLGREVRKRRWKWLGWMDVKRMRSVAAADLARLHIDLPHVGEGVRWLSGGQRQAISVGRAVTFGRSVVIMDEPTAALGVEQTALVLELIGRLRDEGVAVLLVSHNMHDVLEVCDRVVVLRHGTKTAEIGDLSGVTPRELVDAITGADLEADVRHGE